MADDLRDALHFWGSVLQQKAQSPGGLRSKTTFLEGAFMAVNALKEVDQRNRGETYHPDNLLFVPLLEGDFHAAVQKVMEVGQLMQDAQFDDLCERFMDFSATLSDPQKRKRAMMLFGLMMTAHKQGVPGYAVAPPPAQQRAPEPPRVAIAPPAPPHPNEALFRPYMELGHKAGAEKIARDFEKMTKTEATEFFGAFLKYAITLRTSDELKVAFALSNKMYVIYVTQQASERLAIAAPGGQRR